MLNIAFNVSTLVDPVTCPVSSRIYLHVKDISRILVFGANDKAVVLVSIADPQDFESLIKKEACNSLLLLQRVVQLHSQVNRRSPSWHVVCQSLSLECHQ